MSPPTATARSAPTAPSVTVATPVPPAPSTSASAQLTPGWAVTDAVADPRGPLVDVLAWIASLLDAHIAGGPAPQSLDPDACPATAAHIAARLGLSTFERDVLLLAAAVELDGRIAERVARLQGGDPRPTFALALAMLPDPHWDALTPGRPLRRWGLVELGTGTPLAGRPMVLDEAILHDLTGLGDGAEGLPEARERAVLLTASQERLADEVARAVAGVGTGVLVALDGPDRDAQHGVAARLAEALGLSALVLREAALPDPGPPLAAFALRLDRAAVLHDRLPVVGSIALVDLLDAPVVVRIGGRDGGPELDRAPADRIVVSWSVDLPPTADQRRVWTTALPPDATREVVAAAADLAVHHRLTTRAIITIVDQWSTGTHGQRSSDELRRIARERTRVDLGPMAQRIEPRATWDDLVMPEGQQVLLEGLVAQVRHRDLVHREWGFADRGERGLGVTALFTGESGTGKTLAAEVIATELGLDLHRVDLAGVVSKYIGETEKNLAAVFTAAEASGAVLLFDEADALFGRRSDVKDSHDRYANLEVAYLLARMEAYRGLAILTTNLRSTVDSAFLRRLRLVVAFPFPDAALRERIWAIAFPPGTPTDGLDPAGLARMQVSGGTIRAIAVGAAFTAAAAGSPVRPEHVLHAAQVEYAKAERSLTSAEISWWTGPR